MECMECLNEDAQKEERIGHFPYIEGRDNQITTSTKLFDAIYNKTFKGENFCSSSTMFIIKGKLP